MNLHICGLLHVLFFITSLVNLNDNWQADEVWWTNKDEKEHDKDMIILSQPDYKYWEE